MIFALLTLLAALAVAAVTEWFSVVGIMAIYAGAPFNAALIMGLVLGGAKLVAISWLYRNWTFSSWFIKGPLIYFTMALMIASSIGVYGFLTKSHLEQSASTVDNSAKIERLEQQIAREKAIINDNEKVILQLDTSVNSFLGNDKTDRALAVKRSQSAQRKQLKEEIAEAQKSVDLFSDEKLKLTSEIRALELEVGPIKYIANLLYGSNSNDASKIESAVVIFTLLIVSTLDPLAVILLIAANHTLVRLKNEKTQTAKKVHEEYKKPTYLENSFDTRDKTDSTNYQINITEENSTSKSLSNNISQENPTRAVSAHTEIPAVDETIPMEESKDEQIGEEKEIHINKISDATEHNAEQVPVYIEVQETVLPIQTETLTNSMDRNEPVSTQKIEIVQQPWAHQEGLINELIGNNAHFIPVRLNEKSEIRNLENHTTGESDTPEEKIKEVEEISSGQEKKETKPLLSSNTGSNEQDLHKYPKALSWLKEFKGN